MLKQRWRSKLLPLLGWLCCAAHASPPTLNYQTGGSIRIQAPALPAGAQLALIPGGSYRNASVALKNPAQAIASAGRHVLVAAGDSGLLIFDFAAQPRQRLLAQIKGQGAITRIALHDGYAYLADTSNALLIVDVRNPQQPGRIARYPLTQPLDALCVEAGRAYLVSGRRLTILDVAQPQAPRLLAAYTLADEASAVQVAGAYAYLALPEVGLSIVDVHDVARIRETGRFRGEVWDVAVAQERAYLANGNTGLTVLDVSQPQAPRWLGSVNHIGMSLALQYDSGYVALRSDRSEIILVDVGNPQLPAVSAVYRSEQPLYAIALQQKQVLAGSANTLAAIEFSAPTPDLVNFGANFGGSRRAVIRDQILYVADWFSGLHLYGISAPSAPRHLGSYHTQGSPKGVLVRGATAFVADDDHGVQILDISDPGQPRKISEVATPGLAYTMKLIDDYLYLADHRGGFHIISVADIAHPFIVGSAVTAGRVWAVDVVGNQAYLAADKAGLLVFNVTDPKQPQQIAAYDLGGAAEDVVIRDRLAYVASFDRGLVIFDVSDPAQPREISRLATPGNARGIELQGHLAYLADWVSGIQIVDVDNPAQPALIGSFDTSGWSWGVRVQDHYAYVLDWWGGINVLDVADPAAPILAGAYHARGMAQDVAVRDSYAYVASGENGLQIFDIKNPLNPVWIAGVDAAGDAQSLWLSDNTAYLACGGDGVLAIDIGNPFQPQRLRQIATPADLVRAQGNLVYAADRSRGVAVIDAASGQPVAWYAAEIQDMWPAPGRLLVATPGGVEIVGLDDPAHPQLLERLPQRAELLRLQGNLLALYDKKTGIALYDYTTLKPLGSFNPGEEIFELQLIGNRLYASGSRSGLLVLDIANPLRPALQAAYPAASHVGKLSVFSGTAFLAGNETLTSVRLLPAIGVARGKRGGVALSVPKELPPGSYHLLALDAKSGKRAIYHDVLRIALPAPKKPGFTLQDFERAMRERGLTAAPQP